MAKYIDLPNLKENLTNFLNKKINPIYAKKTEIPSNVSELNNDKSYQTAEEVGQAVTDGVARIVAGAPEDFDTLKEMSDWISSHETSAAAMNSAISDNSVAIANHTSNSDIHVTKEEKIKWNKLDSNLKDGTIIVAEATKATQDAQGNVIDSTYAKKTEVPQGTVVDDSLSSTSINPVQNKVVKAEFDQVNSNLSDIKMLGWSVPKECPVQNYVDSDGVFHQRVGRVDLGSLSWHTYLFGNIDCFYALVKERKVINNNIYTSNYSTSNNSPSTLNDKEINGTSNENYIYIRDNTYGTDVNQFKQAVKGKYLYFELAEEKTISVDGNEAVTKVNDSLSVIGKCKNLLNPTLQTATINGVTCTDNGDGTYTLNGTASSQTTFVFAQLKASNLFKNGITYKFCGCPKLNNNIWFSIEKQTSPYTVYVSDYGNGGTFTYTSNDDTIYIFVRINEGIVLDNVVLKPMITTNLNATYDDFIPYTGDGDTLTADVAELKNDLSNLKDGTTPVAKAVADEDGNNIKSTYATKAKAFIDYSHKSVDLDTLTTAPSLISIGYDVTNKPSKFYGGYMFVVNAGYSASIALYQILFDVLYNKTYQRKYYHGSWTAWSYVTTPQDIETITLTTTSGTATLYKLGKMRHLVLNNATFSSTNVIASTDASVGTLYIRAEILISGSGGDELEGAAASFEDICISGSSMWNATRTATGTSPIAVQGATGSATWIVQ